MAVAYVGTVAGFVLLAGGGELLVNGAVTVSRRLGLSPLLVGMTVVSLCTSAPELVVSVKAALAGDPAIAVGNVVGSNIANVVLVLGLAALVRPLVVDRADIRPDALMMVAASAALVVLGIAGSVTRLGGLVLVAALVFHVVTSYRRERAAGTAATDWHVEEVAGLRPRFGLAGAVAALALGLAALVFGADLLVAGAIEIAGAFGVPSDVIGLTVVALGTSLPELATSIAAVVRGQPDVAVGNAIGSCTFNILAILGVTSLTTPLAIAPELAGRDIPIMFAVAAVAAVVLMARGRAGRLIGASMTAGYVAYVVVLFAGPRG